METLACFWRGRRPTKDLSRSCPASRPSQRRGPCGTEEARAFLPTKDFEESKEFFVALGFTLMLGVQAGPILASRAGFPAAAVEDVGEGPAGVRERLDTAYLDKYGHSASSFMV